MEAVAIIGLPMDIMPSRVSRTVRFNVGAKSAFSASLTGTNMRCRKQRRDHTVSLTRATRSQTQYNDSYTSKKFGLEPDGSLLALVLRTFVDRARSPQSISTKGM